MTMLQELDLEILFDGAQAPVGPMRMATRSTLSMTQKTGAAAPNGTLEAEITYDTIRTETSMNGQPLPMPDAGGELVGKPVVVTYDRNGDIVDVRGLPAGGLTADTFKQMVNAFRGNLPVAALGVGEVTSVPMDFTLPLPFPGAGPMAMSGDTTLKLATIENDAKGRTARFESTLDGKVSSTFPTPDPRVAMSLDLTMRGGGRMITDIENRFIRSNESLVTFDGTIKSAEPAATSPPGMTMRGTMKIAMTGSNTDR